MHTPDAISAAMRDVTEIQRLLDEAYDHYFEHSDGHCKSSEGYVGLQFNNYHDRRAGDPLKIVGVEIYSYVLGPHRSHEFTSTEQALATVREWHAKQMATDYSDGGPLLPVEKLMSDQSTDYVTVVSPEVWDEMMRDDA